MTTHCNLSEICNVTTQELADNWEAKFKSYTKDDLALFGSYNLSIPEYNFGFRLFSESSYSDKDRAPPFFNATLLYKQQASNGYFGSGIDPPSRMVGQLAAHVTIALCSQTMATRMEGGITHTQILESQTNLQWSSSEHTSGNTPRYTASTQARDKTNYTVTSILPDTFTDYFKQLGFVASTQIVDGYGSRRQEWTTDPEAGFDALTPLSKDLLGANYDTLDPIASFENIVHRMDNISASMTNA